LERLVLSEEVWRAQESVLAWRIAFRSSDGKACDRLCSYNELAEKGLTWIVSQVLIKERNSLRAHIQTLESSAVSTVAADTDVCESSVNSAFAIFWLVEYLPRSRNKYLLLSSLRYRPMKTQRLAKDHEALCQKLDGLYQAAAEKDGRIAEVRPRMCT
jgi:hypothetical protein